MHRNITKLRHGARRLLDTALAPRPSTGATSHGSPTVVGLFGAASGIGESARLCFDALDDMGLSPDAIDLSAAFGQAHLPIDRFRPATAGNRGILIVHVNPPELARALRQVGRARLKHRKVVGYWAWELPVAPPAWRRAMSFVHEVWVPSRYCADAFGSTPPRPVRVVPHVLEPAPPALPSTQQNAQFRVRAAGDVRSSLARKNLAGAIIAFRRAFGDRTDVSLEVKVTHGARDDAGWRALEALAHGASNIALNDAVLSQDAQWQWIADADAILSLHRAEGFGLMLASAMISGKPVVATGWSGNMDFMTADTACLVGYDLVPVEDMQGIYRDRSQRWAEPRIEEATNWLTRLRAAPELRRDIGERARAGYPAEQFREAFARAIEAAAVPL